MLETKLETFLKDVFEKFTKFSIYVTETLTIILIFTPATNDSLYLPKKMCIN